MDRYRPEFSGWMRAIDPNLAAEDTNLLFQFFLERRRAAGFRRTTLCTFAETPQAIAAYSFAVGGGLLLATGVLLFRLPCVCAVFLLPIVLSVAAFFRSAKARSASTCLP